MSKLALFVGLLLIVTGTAMAATPKESAHTPAPPPLPTPAAQVPERYQLVVVPGHPGSPFLLDTATGCIWHQLQNEQTKRTTFVEVDVENLHWSWGSGAQTMLAARVDGSNLTDEQKRVLKESLQRTGCGVSSVVLTPGSPTQPQTPASK